MQPASSVCKNHRASQTTAEVTISVGDDPATTPVVDIGMLNGALFEEATGPLVGFDAAEQVGRWTVTETVVTPLPAALPLFATGLGALGLLGWRRKKKARSA